MRDIILAIAVLLFFALGSFVMKCVDLFLSKINKSAETELEPQSPSYVMLTGDLKDDELLKAIHQFRDCHESMQIYLCEDMFSNLMEPNPFRESKK
ncbi:MAG: hypothetical protein ACI4AQ_08620 [Lachnospiraceae bacterium]